MYSRTSSGRPLMRASSSHMSLAFVQRIIVYSCGRDDVIFESGRRRRTNKTRMVDGCTRQHLTERQTQFIYVVADGAGWPSWRGVKSEDNRFLDENKKRFSLNFRNRIYFQKRSPASAKACNSAYNKFRMLMGSLKKSSIKSAVSPVSC